MANLCLARISHLMIVLSYMEKHCGHVASLATYSLVYNLCAELDQVVHRSAPSSPDTGSFTTENVGRMEKCAQQSALVSVQGTRLMEG